MSNFYVLKGDIKGDRLLFLGEGRQSLLRESGLVVEKRYFPNFLLYSIFKKSLKLTSEKVACPFLYNLFLDLIPVDFVIQSLTRNTQYLGGIAFVPVGVSQNSYDMVLLHIF